MWVLLEILEATKVLNAFTLMKSIPHPDLLNRAQIR